MELNPVLFLSRSLFWIRQCLVRGWRIFVLVLLLALRSVPCFPSEQELVQLEQEIWTLLRDRARVPVQASIARFCKESPDTSGQVCRDALLRLKSTLQKIKNFKDLSNLNSIEIHSEPRWKTNTFLWNGKLDLIFYGAKDESVPWISILSGSPLEEDAPELRKDLVAAMIQQLRERSLEGKTAASFKAELPFQPYSSSFLSIREGKILKKPEEQNPEILPQLNERLRSTYQSTSPIQRFDQMRRSHLGQSRPVLTREFEAKVYDPQAKEWEGYCHQWTAAALDPQINEFIASTQGLICKDLYLSEGELEELFSLFYTQYQSRLLSGKRAHRSPTLNDRILRNELGLDDLSPADFHKNIFQYLKSKKGLALEISPDEDVWNQPVYQAETTSSKAFTSGADLKSLAPLIPADLLKATRVEDEEPLRQYQILEKKLQDWQQAEESLSTSDQEWLAKATHFAKELLDRPQSELLGVRNELILKWLVPGLQSGRIQLKKGVMAQRVVTRVDYSDEGFDLLFASTGLVSKSKEFEYLIFSQNDQVVGSRWITSPIQRPDFIWAYDQPKNPKTGSSILSSEVQDLFRLGKTCQSAREVFFFFYFIRQAIADSHLSESEKSEIRARYQAIAAVLSQERLRELFAREKLEGLDLSELFGA